LQTEELGGDENAFVNVDPFANSTAIADETSAKMKDY